MLRNRTPIFAFFPAVIAVLSFAVMTPSLGGPKTHTVKTGTSRGKMTHGTPSVHLKMIKGKNSRGKEISRKRGDTGTIEIKNMTGWYIDCYIDGSVVGQVGPYGSLFVHPTTGDHDLYGVATFDDGSKKTWGPQTQTLDLIYIWALTE